MIYLHLKSFPVAVVTLIISSSDWSILVTGSPISTLSLPTMSLNFSLICIAPPCNRFRPRKLKSGKRLLTPLCHHTCRGVIVLWPLSKYFYFWTQQTLSFLKMLPSSFIWSCKFAAAATVLCNVYTSKKSGGSRTHSPNKTVAAAVSLRSSYKETWLPFELCSSKAISVIFLKITLGNCILKRRKITGKTVRQMCQRHWVSKTSASDDSV